MHVAEKFDRARQIINLALDENAYISYSQFGEDLLIDVIFTGKTGKGFYVDIGAHHPRRFSNTYLLYEKGWRGINVDGDSTSIDSFQRAREQDVNICAVVSDRCEDVNFSIFSDSAVNTISPQRKLEYAQRWSVVSSHACRATTLEILLDQHLPESQQIDILNVDVEGADLQVLQGNNWEKYRPYLIIIEIDEVDLMNASTHPVASFLSERGYKLYSLIHISAFFVRVR